MKEMEQKFSKLLNYYKDEKVNLIYFRQKF